MSKRCATSGCGKWANQGLLCKDCAKIPDAVRAADVVGRMSDIMTMPAIQTLVRHPALRTLLRCCVANPLPLPPIAACCRGAD